MVKTLVVNEKQIAILKQVFQLETTLDIAALEGAIPDYDDLWAQITKE
jgi:hypothetical protein